MFLLKRNPKSTSEIAEVVNPTIQLPTTREVLDQIILTQEQEPTAEHLRNYHELVDSEKRGFTKKERDSLKELGFHVFIQSQWIGKFIYHANVFTPKKVHEAVHAQYRYSDGELAEGDNWDIGDEVNYKGDIPDIILKKAILAKPIVCQISIHSMTPLPVEFVHYDPILIGWSYCPRIQVNSDGKFDKVWIPNAEGVIIAIWNYDKEIDALG